MGGRNRAFLYPDQFACQRAWSDLPQARARNVAVRAPDQPNCKIASVDDDAVMDGLRFTNDDLVRSSSLVEDYEHALLGTVETDQGEAWHIELKTRPEAPVAWDRMLMWIRTADDLPVKAEFFNERGELVRTIAHDDFREVGGRTLPTRMELTETRFADRKTILQIEDMTFDASIDPEVFTQRNLRRAR